jgi:N-acetyltransferase
VTSRWSVPALRGFRVSLEPLSLDHVDGLTHAADEDRSTYSFTAIPPDFERMREYVEGLLEDQRTGVVVPFSQVDLATNSIVGMTRYLTIRYRPGDSTPFAVEIGGTWLAASAQRSGINTEAKFLLLQHAFDVWGVARVDLKTDSRNVRSRVAIARLGATFEGVLRHWQPSQVVGEENHYRDTAMYSIVDSQWPSISSQLRAVISFYGGQPAQP